MADIIVLYRRLSNGDLVQYKFGGRSAYLSLVKKSGRREMLRHYSITDVAAAARTIPSGTPVPPEQVPAEPSLADALDKLDTLDTLEAPTTPKEAAASGFGYGASGAAGDEG